MQGAAGCDSLVYLNLTINEIDTSITNNSPNLSSNQTSGSYQWIDCSTDSLLMGETDQNFTATLNGSYAVILDNGVCIDTSACYQVNNIGLLNLNPEQSIKLFPNPSSGLLTISFDKEIAHKIAVISPDGRQIFTSMNNSNEFRIDLRNCSDGVYLIKLMFDSSSAIFRMIKE